MKVKFVAVLIFVNVSLIACIPTHLQKYVTEPTANSSMTETTQAVRSSNVVTKSRINVLDAKTFRFEFAKQTIWDAALTVILRNYNIGIANQDDGLITTDWDTFYLHDKVYRNKLSMRLQRMPNNTVELVIHNSLEKLQDKTTVGTVAALWLPDTDNNNEVSRIINNMAILLNQPEVVVPSNGNIAQSVQ